MIQEHRKLRFSATFCDRVGLQKDLLMMETSKQNFKIAINNYAQLLLLYG